MNFFCVEKKKTFEKLTSNQIISNSREDNSKARNEGTRE